MSTTTTPKANLFATAKKKTPAASKAKAHPEVLVTEKQHEGFSAKLIELAEIRQRLNEDEARAKSLEDEIKTQGKSAFIDLYLEKKQNPGSFIIKGEEGGRFLVITQDKYAGIDEARYNELSTNYGENVVTKTTTYSLDSAILINHMEAISEAISGIESMSDEEKAGLFIADEKFTVAKGAINLVPTIKEEEQIGFIYNIQPQVQLKYSEEK